MPEDSESSAVTWKLIGTPTSSEIEFEYSLNTGGVMSESITFTTSLEDLPDLSVTMNSIRCSPDEYSELKTKVIHY